MTELNLSYVQAQLQRRRDQRQLAAVARGAQVDVRTLNRILDGQPINTGKAELVQAFLKQTEQQKKLDDA